MKVWSDETWGKNKYHISSCKLWEVNNNKKKKGRNVIDIFCCKIYFVEIRPENQRENNMEGIFYKA